MKTNIRAFQRDFPRMRRLAAAGTVIVVESEGQSFEFHAPAPPIRLTRSFPA
ncbi:MAG: hypothetical protein RL077_4864 [Verrucomicrobiota bacterium]|jgi:hypothetical protein